MSGFSFAGSEDKAGTNVKFLKAGIHEFEILDMYYIAAGQPLKDATKKDGSEVTFDKNNIILKVKVLNTNAGNDSEGAEANLLLNEPQIKGDGKDKGRIDRMFHILCNITSSENKDKFKAQLESFKFASFGDVASKLVGVLKGKKVRYKIVASSGKGAYFPSYFGGIAEPIDVPFNKTTLNFIVGGNEDIIQKGSTNLEANMPTLTESSFDFSQTATNDSVTDLFGSDEVPF